MIAMFLPMLVFFPPSIAPQAGPNPNVVRQPRTSTSYSTHPPNPRDELVFAQDLSSLEEFLPPQRDARSIPWSHPLQGPRHERDRGMRERLFPKLQVLSPMQGGQEQIANHRHRCHVDTWLSFSLFSYYANTPNLIHPSPS
ncbi:hypothetical protein BDP55DRAFT_301959 [Colletotrichum godetiae]|uniref:Uncharacterized protein n=1 Tax=Colletotrichum godetiae TaxID=1209918 RepID=A0AAJ0AUK8_9PEZI|nr:uncharacterized protein BDP55DRAFT_301959 [Colletotrichum godetiae]KAK1690648.1 hypothetical protein BDP55DRAFT_301959 [Colletotrichum godetiae]